MLRDAGNILAGMNAKDHGQSFSDYMRGAGGYQQAGIWGAFGGLVGKEYGLPPYYGEQQWTGQAVWYGYSHVSQRLGQ